MKEYLNEFFDELEIYEDIYNKKNYKESIKNAIIMFLNEPIYEKALEVYKSFFYAYWIGIQEETNPFIELINRMNMYEKNAGKLLMSQRDHFIHSVNVFLLGIVIYRNSSNFEASFDNTIKNKSSFKDFYTTRNEEFFYRWGNASLFHDIAYPLEITLKQAKLYLDFLTTYPSCNSAKQKIGINMEIYNLKEFTELPILKPVVNYKEEFYDKYPNYKNWRLENSIEALAYKLSKCFRADFQLINNELNNFNIKMKNEGFIDHGFYSALIIMKWYNHLIKETEWNPAYFYYPVVDFASAILLHNYYRQGLMKKPFNLKSMNVEQHPISFLLILCDELQEWQREEYGDCERDEEFSGFSINISNEKLVAIYETKSKIDKHKFIEKKENLINSILNLESVFKQGIKIEVKEE